MRRQDNDYVSAVSERSGKFRQCWQFPHIFVHVAFYHVPTTPVLEYSSLEIRMWVGAEPSGRLLYLAIPMQLRLLRTRAPSHHRAQRSESARLLAGPDGQGGGVRDRAAGLVHVFGFCAVGCVAGGQVCGRALPLGLGRRGFGGLWAGCGWPR